MRAITYTGFGPASEVLTLENLPSPTPAAGEVLVRLTTSGVNPSDIRARAGGRPGVTKPPFPKIIPHSDGAGVIEAVGDGIDRARIGERVWIWNGQWQRPFGTAADYIALPSAQAVELPDNTSFTQGAVLGIPALTAIHTVLGAGPVSGKLVLLSGGGGTVGRLAVQIAAASGARVVTTCHGEADSLAAKAAGADIVLDYRSATLADDVLDATGGAFIDHAVEVEFGQNIEMLTKVIREGGRIVAYGSARDMTPTLPFYPLMFKAVSIDLALIYLLRDAERATAIANLTRLLVQDALDLRVSETLPLEDCAKAHDIVAAGDRAGSIILTM
ncbi:MAG: NADPH2:quinone reductase [Yoonia sp.]|jgi:NADPH2:quinone reductase